MGKLPYFPFFPGDWLSDPCLRRCSFEAKGFWIDLLSLMWQNENRGELNGTLSELSRMLGLPETEFERLVEELEATKTGDVTRSNGTIMVVSRRMVRDEKDRNSNAYRQAKHRTKNKNNGRVTDLSRVNNKDMSYSSSNSYSENRELALQEKFDEFWKHYPRKAGKLDAFKAFKSLNANEELMVTIIEDIEVQKKTKQWKEDNGEFIPYPATYIRAKRWTDEGIKISKRGAQWTN